MAFDTSNPHNVRELAKRLALAIEADIPGYSVSVVLVIENETETIATPVGRNVVLIEILADALSRYIEGKGAEVIDHDNPELN